MPKIHEGKLVAEGQRVAIVASRWNSFITDRMLGGAMDALVRHGISEDDIEVIRVPGTWEIPFAVRKAAKTGAFNAIITIGCLIRGSTPHFEYLAQEVTRSLGQIGIETEIPISYGIIAVENLEQAIERAGTKAGNKGAEAALAAIEMANLSRSIPHA